MTQWKAITHALHRHGGGPLRRIEFDSEIETEAAAVAGITRARKLGLVKVEGLKFAARWTLTDLGREWAEGRVMLVDNAWRRLVETDADRQQRIARLVNDAEEAATTCARLTKRQRQVLVLAAKGFAPTEIAQMLDLNRSTVTKHTAQMLAALGCTRSIEAAVIAAKAGIV